MTAELADFNPGDGHRHMCSPTSPRYCRCAAELYALAARLDREMWAHRQAHGDATAAAHGVRGHRYPRTELEATLMRRLADGTLGEPFKLTPEAARQLGITLPPEHEDGDPT